MYSILFVVYCLIGLFYVSARMRAIKILTGEHSLLSFLIQLVLWPIEAHAMLTGFIAQELAMRALAQAKKEE